MLQSFAPRGVSTPVPDDAESYRMAACQPEIADAKETKIESRALTVVPVDVGRGVLTLDVEQALAQRTPPTAPAREGARACHRSEHPGGGGGEYPSESAQVRGGTRQRSARFCVALQRRGAAWCTAWCSSIKNKRPIGSHPT